MIARSAVRRAASLLVIVAVLAWSHAALAVAVENGHGGQCHRPPAPVQHTHYHGAECCSKTVQVMTCCPQHSAAAPDCAASAACCEVRQEPMQAADPQRVTISPKLRAIVPAPLVALASPSVGLRAAPWLSADSPAYSPPVLQQKEDLRI